jgi:hypothetical protein
MTNAQGLPTKKGYAFGNYEGLASVTGKEINRPIVAVDRLSSPIRLSRADIRIYNGRPLLSEQILSFAASEHI